jgi:hypothetical protein
LNAFHGFTSTIFYGCYVLHYTVNKFVMSNCVGHTRKEILTNVLNYIILM